MTAKTAESGISTEALFRAAQWLVGLPIIWSFSVRLIGLGALDPFDPFLTGLVGPTIAKYGMLGVAFALEITDRMLLQHEEEYQNRLHEIIKDVGDRLRAGKAVETSVAEAAARGGGPSKVFREAIRLSDELPFEGALRVAGDRSGKPYLREVMYLMAEAVSSGGDTGSALRRLGMELERNRQYQISVAAKLSSPIALMRSVGLVMVPPLYAALRWSFAGFVGIPAGPEAGAQVFFLYGAFAITVFDGLIFGQWDRLGARLPLAAAAVYCGLNWI